jgi:hypothetical protein
VGSADAGGAVINIEPNFIDHLAALDPAEQRQCLAAIKLFEFEFSPSEQYKKSHPVDGADRRRLRFIRASNVLRAIYARSNNDRSWLWVGRAVDVMQVGKKFDAMPPESLEEFDIGQRLAELSGSNDYQDAIEDQALIGPPDAEVERWVEQVDTISLFMAETKALAQRVKTRIKADPINESKFRTLLGHFNATTAERERLKSELASLKKRAETLEVDLRTNRTSFDQVNAAKRRAEAVAAELDKIKKGAAASALSEEVKVAIKERCAKICDDQAARISGTGRPRDEDEAEDLRRIAVLIRALKA